VWDHIRGLRADQIPGKYSRGRSSRGRVEPQRRAQVEKSSEAGLESLKIPVKEHLWRKNEKRESQGSLPHRGKGTPR